LAEKELLMASAWEVRVACDALGGPDDPPKRIFSGGRTIEVVQVIDRWLGADHAYYKVRGADDAIYVLRRGAFGEWRLIMFDRTQPPVRASEG
jgi:hypothetical protein